MVVDSDRLSPASDESAQPEIAGEARAARIDVTVAKGLAVLETLVKAGRPLRISALSDMLGLGRSNVHRLLNTMIELGYVRKDSETRQYSLTLKLWEFGCAVAEHDWLLRNARPAMLDLLNEVGETVYLVALDETEVIYLEHFLTTRLSLLGPRNGRRVPAIFPASGRVQLAYHPRSAELVDKILAEDPRAAGIDREKTLKEFAEIRNKGYAITESGWTRGLNSLCVPIISNRSEVLAALGIGFFPTRDSVKRMKEFLPSLTRAANEISAAVGSGPASFK